MVHKAPAFLHGVVCVGRLVTEGRMFVFVGGFLRRGQRLEESLEYQQFVANVEEEEAWINEKLNLVGSEDYGDTLAAVQVRQVLYLSWPIKTLFLIWGWCYIVIALL